MNDDNNYYRSIHALDLIIIQSKLAQSIPTQSGILVEIYQFELMSGSLSLYALLRDWSHVIILCMSGLAKQMWR